MSGIIKISERLSYIKACEEPLSADVGIVLGDRYLWVFDVGAVKANAEYIRSFKKPVICVLSHFHQDHIGAIESVDAEKIYLGANTKKYVGRGEAVTDDLYFDDGVKIHIFPLPSSHAKGSIGLEADGYAFLGDGTYSCSKNGKIFYNATLLKDEIDRLRSLEAKYFLLSHDEKFVFSRGEVISELDKIYSLRQKDSPYIFLQSNVTD